MKIETTITDYDVEIARGQNETRVHSRSHTRYISEIYIHEITMRLMMGKDATLYNAMLAQGRPLKITIEFEPLSPSG